MDHLLLLLMLFKGIDEGEENTRDSILKEENLSVLHEWSGVIDSILRLLFVLENKIIPI